MKIVIGITRQPEKIAEYVHQYQGKADTATEVGPFLSQEDARKWLDSLKSKIYDLEEIPWDQKDSQDAIYYGFTFERISKSR